MKRIAFVLIVMISILTPAFGQTPKAKPAVHTKAPVVPVVDPQTILSDDLKQTVKAAADTSSTMHDISAYIHDGRVQIRTAKDREVFDDLLKYVQFTDDATAEASEAASMEISAASDRGYASDLAMMEIGEERPGSGTYNLQNAASSKRAAADALTEADKAEKAAQDDLSAKKRDFETATGFYLALRADLGLSADLDLPALPAPPAPPTLVLFRDFTVASYTRLVQPQ